MIKPNFQENLFWHHVFPFLNWLPTLNRRIILGDLLAGITGAVIVLPQGVAYVLMAPPGVESFTGSPEFVKLALMLTFLAGVFQFALGLARLGTLVNFVSHSVVVGFTAGTAILIATSQH